MYCQNCGKQIEDNIKFCPECGNATENVVPSDKKNYLITLLLCLFLGFLGVHRFYTRYIGEGIAQLILTLSVIGIPLMLIWVFIDLISIILGKYKPLGNSEPIVPEFKIPNAAKKVVCIILGCFGLFFILCSIIGLTGALNQENITVQNIEDNSILTKEKYGEEYPYTIDNLRLKCENYAVWVEDSALNKYALNGLADAKFQGRRDYKGYTTEIQDKTKTPDGNFLDLGFKLCK